MTTTHAYIANDTLALPPRDRREAIVATDGELLMRFVQDQDHLAFAQIVERHGGLVWIVCREVLGHHQDVEDAFQATFIILAQRARKIHSSESAAAWLYKVAQRTSLAARRQRSRRREEELVTDPAADDEVVSLIQDRQMIHVLMEELRELPDRYQVPLILRYFEGHSRRTIADQTDSTLAQIQGRLVRGKRMLRSRLLRRSVSLSLAAGAVANVAAEAGATLTPQVAVTTAKSCLALKITGATGGATASALALAKQGAKAMWLATLMKAATAVSTAFVAAGVLWATQAGSGTGQGKDTDLAVQTNKANLQVTANSDEHAANAGTPTPASENAPAVPSGTPSPAKPKATLRYDGKTFDDWRNAWQTELSTEKRMEAVKALAAFGRAGYGKEATEAILDVAGQYDFLEIDSSPEGKLKETVLDELAPQTGAPQALAIQWVHGISERLSKDPKKWKWLAAHLFSRLYTTDPDTLNVLRSFAKTDDSQLRLQVLTALIRNGQNNKDRQLDETTHQLIDEAIAKGLRDNDLELLVRILRPLGPYKYYSSGGLSDGDGVGREFQWKLLHRPKDLPALLFYANADVRRGARGLLTYLDENDAHTLTNDLVAVLKDEKRKADHVEALRALAAMGARGKSAASNLVSLLVTSNDQATLDAAVIALLRCTGQPFRPNAAEFMAFTSQALRESATDPQQKAIVERLYGSNEKQESLLKRLTEEDKTILPRPNPNLGGGGDVLLAPQPFAP